MWRATIPDIEADYAYADAMTCYMIERPEHFDVIVTENMFGDIITDLGAASVGSMGMSPSAELGLNHGFFQAAHGSAPTIAGQNIANPYGTILSAASMLEWLGERHGDERLSQAAQVIERSVGRALLEPSGSDARPRRQGVDDGDHAARDRGAALAERVATASAVRPSFACCDRYGARIPLRCMSRTPHPAVAIRITATASKAIASSSFGDNCSRKNRRETR